MRFVGRKIVPEVFEISALTSAHQGLRRGPVESKMPDAWIVVHGLPSCDSGKERVHQRELFCLRWKLRGISVGHHQPDVVPDDPSLRDAKRLGQRVNANGVPL